MDSTYEQDTTYLYRIVAENVVGYGGQFMQQTVRSYSNVVVVGPTPLAPSDLVATPGDGQVTVSFTPPAVSGAEPPTDYVVSFRQQGTGTWTWFPEAVSTTPQLTVTGLANGTTYEFMVAGVNAAGLGAWSTPVVGTPNGVGAVPPQAPYNLSTTPGNGQVTVNFTAPAANGGSAITDYVVVWRQQGGGTWHWFPEGVSATPQLTVTGLANGTTYEFMVAGVNAAGLGTGPGPGQCRAPRRGWVRCRRRPPTTCRPRRATAR